MDAQTLTYIFVFLTFGLYIGIAIWARASSTSEFYVAGGGVHPIANGMATAADWMSAASFISMAGIISFMGYDGTIYLLGWTGGYVILALLLAPYLRKFGEFTVPDFIGTRYYSSAARIVAVIALIAISFTYIAGQMRGVGIVFSQFLNIPITWGVVVGMAVVFMYAVLGGMKGITYTQVAQYCVLIFAYLVPAIFISIMITGVPLPQLGLGATVLDGSGLSVLGKLDATLVDLGFAPYTQGLKSKVDVFAITLALMIGTAGLPHVIVRFFTVPKVSDARRSAGYALLFIAILYTTAPAVGAFARLNFIDTVHDERYTEVDSWFKSWEDIGLIGWEDKNKDGRIQYHPGSPFEGRPTYSDQRREDGSRTITNPPTSNTNEVYVDRDIMVLANPEIAALPPWVIALVAAGGLAAALSTAAGLLLVISTSVSHDLIKKTFAKNLSDKRELLAARLSAAVAIVIAGYFGIFPFGFVAQVVAFAFGLAAASLFPALLLGIFDKRMNTAGAISGMICGLAFTLIYIAYFKFMAPELNNAEHWWFGISPEGIGSIGAAINFAVAFAISRLTAPVPAEVLNLVENIRIPKGVNEPHNH
ncbi:MAG: cation acetate symporter [Gammaproteobacteria bacterium]|jgi:cation/acetate symporter|nr:cation acetate symporter [Gammaproteobacteria bacterium]MCH1551308.1 cation acetate symporter [Pseudomonadales bacterium]